MQSIYQALPLDDGCGDIRLLKFRKRNAPRGLEDIELSLIRASADEIPYTCLSYVWGDPTAREQITLNGTRVTITKSLYEALQAFQMKIQSSSLENIDYFLWADSLCINQQDITEKTAQVQRMTQIYTNADSVWAWLGPLELDIELVIEECNTGGEMLCRLVSTLSYVFEGHASSVSSLGSSVEVVPAIEGITDAKAFALIPEIAGMGHPKYLYALAYQLGWPESSTQSTRNFPPHAIEILRVAWMRFCDRPFWKRIWILQELALGTNVYLVSGTASTKLEYLLTIWALFMVTFGSPSRHEIWSSETWSYVGTLMDKGNMISSILGIKLNRPRDVIRIITFSRVLLATEDKDRIFGLLGVGSDVKALGIVADYSMTLHEICIDLARRLVLHYGVQALCYAMNHPRDVEVPSWVTFYSMLKYPNYSLHEIHATRNSEWDFAFSSSGETSQKFDEQSLISPLLLRVRGVFVDTIQTAIPTRSPTIEQKVSMPLKDLEFTHKVMEAINSLAAENNPKYDSNNENSVPIWWLPILHRDPNAAPAPVREMYQAETDKIYRSYMALNQIHVQAETHNSSEISETELYREVMSLATKDCVFFNTTDRRFLGASSQFVDKGDKICLFYGTDTPHVLRPTGNKNQFRLLGEAYVIGIMHGEFLTGHHPVEEFVLE
jgi:hypothetical protein